MRRMTMRHRWVIVGAVAASAAAAAVAQASIPDGNGLISGCYQTNQGQLRVIDAASGEMCRSSEHALSWSQTGPQGPQGPTGPQGPQGPKGDPGPTPTLSVYRVSGPSVTIGAGSVKAVDASCNPSDLATGGGFNVGSAQSVIESSPDPSDARSWFAIVANPTNIDAQANAFVQCLKAHS